VILGPLRNQERSVIESSNLVYRLYISSETRNVILRSKVKVIRNEMCHITGEQVVIFIHLQTCTHDEVPHTKNLQSLKVESQGYKFIRSTPELGLISKISN